MIEDMVAFLLFSIKATILYNLLFGDCGNLNIHTFSFRLEKLRTRRALAGARTHLVYLTSGS